MARDFAKPFYHSPEWKKAQRLYIKQAGGLCERCLQRGIITPGVIVHHKIHLTPENIMDPSITLDPNNLQLLCRNCHADVHKGYDTRYKFDEMGRLIMRPDIPMVDKII